MPLNPLAFPSPPPPPVALVTAEQMRGLDRRTIREACTPGATLMEHAGQAVVDQILRACGSISGQPVTILCGKGNNGGDGLVIARLLHRKRAKVCVLLFGDPQSLTKDAAVMYRRLTTLTRPPKMFRRPNLETAAKHVGTAHIVIDALLGTGLSSPVREPYDAAIAQMNASRAPVVAVDIPSGIDSDTGAVMGTAVRAAMTITFGSPKIGLYLGAGIEHAGEISIADIGIPKQYVAELSPSTHLLTPADIAPLIRTRPRSSHKGTFGHVGLVAGVPGTTGAAALAAHAALRTGAGLVTVATTYTAQPLLEPKLLEAMLVGLPDNAGRRLGTAALPALLEFADSRQAIGVGPGLGTHPETRDLLRQWLPQLTLPCVIDADGLNNLSDDPSLFASLAATPIVTPHPGEMARLLGDSSAERVNQDRLGVATRFAAKHRTFVVLKGARTIVASPDGPACICTTGNPGMATAGMGDVLTGMIASLSAQGYSPWDAARLGVCLHGRAADIAAASRGEAGLIARDVIDHLPHAFSELTSGGSGSDDR